MKYLTNYIEDATSEAMKAAGAFFCFSNKQFDEQKKEDTKYVDMGAGLVCEWDNVKELNKQLNDIIKKGIERDLKENKIDGVIRRELADHEAYMTMSIESTIDALEGYNIEKEDIQAIFNQVVDRSIDGLSERDKYQHGTF